jgi:DNA-binding NtrC family response regulator
VIKKAIVIDDQLEVLDLMSSLLDKSGWQMNGFQRSDEALEALQTNLHQTQLVILDLDLGPGQPNGIDILADLRKKYPKLPVIILTGKGSIQDAVKAMHLNATDFIEKDLEMGERLGLQIKKLDQLLDILQDNRKLRHQNQLLIERVGISDRIIGAEGGLAKVIQKVKTLADIPRPVLIQGERGTGKELIAAALHQNSQRSSGPFITVNCAALSESLVEAELFGHEKGAFTDARNQKPGRFEMADGGTLFLDEIGNMSLAVQQKILRVIEYQCFERVRGTSSIHVDVRITAATNADLQKEMNAERFRRDLYDRLAFDTITMPPLRERQEDIEPLCKFFLERFRLEVAGICCDQISDQAIRALCKYRFPGNVRELKNMIERAAYRCQSQTIQTSDLDIPEFGPATQASDSQAIGFAEQVAAFEKQLICQSMNSSDQNMTNAAKKLGLSYDQFRRLMKKHNIGKTQ